MAMQTGIGFSRLILLVGAGYTGTIVLQNRSLSEILGDLQTLLKGNAKKQGDSSDGDHSDAIAAQVRKLAMEVRQMAMGRQQITLLNGNSGQIVEKMSHDFYEQYYGHKIMDTKLGNLSSLILPAAAVGAVGYGYMWWKGFSFSDLMYVTKQNMSAAVSNLTKQLDHVNEALAAAKRHLTQRIQNLNEKLDDQVEVSKLIRNEIVNVRDDVSQICGDLDALQSMISGLDDKILTLEQKQDLANMGVWYLCNKADGTETSVMKEQLKQLRGNSFGVLPAGMGMKEIANGLGGESVKLITSGNTEEPAPKINNSSPVTRINMSKPVC